METARIQPFCKKQNVKIGCHDGIRACPRKNTERIISLYKYKNHFCSFWKSKGVGFSKEKEQLKIDFEAVDNFISDKHLKILLNMNLNLKKINLI